MICSVALDAHVCSRGLFAEHGFNKVPDILRSLYSGKLAKIKDAVNILKIYIICKECFLKQMSSVYSVNTEYMCFSIVLYTEQRF